MSRHNIGSMNSDESHPSSPVGPTDRIRVRRSSERAAYDAEVVNSILDAGFVAHVGTVRDGQPCVIPMFYVRRGGSLLLHGAPATGTLRRADPDRNGGLPVCVTVTHIDGLVLARSAFHHSINYRSVVVVGNAVAVTDPTERRGALESMVDSLVPGRSRDLRPMTDKEVLATGVLEVPLAEASAKVRQGPPIDDEEDYDLPIWGGVVPMEPTFLAALGDNRLTEGVSLPDNVAALSRRTTS